MHVPLCTPAVDHSHSLRLDTAHKTEHDWRSEVVEVTHDGERWVAMHESVFNYLKISIYRNEGIPSL